MELNDALKQVAVIGAGGKMGRGISALLLQEMALLQATSEGHPYRLTLVDTDKGSFFSLKDYLHEQILKFAEKNIVKIRPCYVQNSNLVSNREIIEEFARQALNLVFIEAELEAAKNAHLVFEAVVEDVEVKAALLSRLKKLNPSALFLTNTSSIPIASLNEKAELGGRIIGYHFYNPPLVQRLLEVVIPEKLDEGLKQLAMDLAKRLQKLVVFSNDVPGFIGNGHFMRELRYASRLAKELGSVHTYAEAVYIINRVTSDYLLRPMGIFQLADYVGLDVCSAIMPMMHLHDELLDWMMDSGNRGGQDAEGNQRPGFFQYKSHHPVAVYALESKTYLPLGLENADRLLGERPHAMLSWKSLQRDLDRKSKIKDYFEALFATDSLGSELAKKFLNHSKEVGRQLVSEGVANKIDDVDAVLENGFYHLYGSQGF